MQLGKKTIQLLLCQSFKKLSTFQVLVIKSECLKYLAVSYYWKEDTASCASHIGLLFADQCINPDTTKGSGVITFSNFKQTDRCA